MHKTFWAAAVLFLPLSAADLRPPSTPLIACDPYFSVWSMADGLPDDATKHWTGAAQSLDSLIRIDGTTYRLMGTLRRSSVTPLPQTSLEVLPTRTIYDFEGQGIHVKLTFLTPTLPEDLDLLSRPVTYLTWRVTATDHSNHAVSIYFDASAQLAVDVPEQDVVAGRFRVAENEVLRLGSKLQPVLEKSGDNLRIDWGYLYVAAPEIAHAKSSIASQRAASDSFATAGTLPDRDDLRTPRQARVEMPVLAYVFDLGRVSDLAVERHVVVAYDDSFSIEYLYRRLRPYWRRTGMEATGLLDRSLREYDDIVRRSQRFDEKTMAELKRAGGEKYARLSALAYRQAFAAQKLAADLDGTPMLFPKENFSNGCISTVDVIYPGAPILLAFNPELLKASLTPLLDYAGLARWKFPFAPHDLGTYPLANGQVYGGGERSAEDQMPVEESANMIIMMGAIAKATGNADYSAKYWPLLSKWADYLKEKGLDPENQLCTDDFAGHLAHNANLSVKAIVALGTYASLADQLGHKNIATDYRGTAQRFAGEWMKMADDGDHYRLTFDHPGTWSQKYNLVWDRLLKLNLFPAEVYRKEVAYYLKHQNPYGLPLDSRKSYTKIDWLLWTATLADSPQDFEAFIAPAYRFANESPSRVPLTDWYDTVTAKQEGFQARSVVGGLFIKLLAENWR
jgi:hypothetical protein